MRCHAPLQGKARPEYLTARVAETPEVAHTSVVEPDGTKLISAGGKLVFQFKSQAIAELELSSKERITVGRVDRLTKEVPTINLTGIGGWENGISRMHVAIEYKDDRLMITDQDSTNGTYINGKRLTAHKPYPLSDGDVLRLGLLSMGVSFVGVDERVPVNYDDHKMMLLVTSG